MRLTILLCLIFSLNAQTEPGFDWGLSIRSRSNHQIFNDIDNTFSELRSRLSLTFHSEKDIVAFAELQDSRVFGQEASTLSNTLNLDLHQAYLEINHLFESDFTLKVGRMEVNHSNQRIVGAVGWHNVGRSLDGGILSYKKDDVLIDIFSHKIVETGLANDSLNIAFNGLRGKFKLAETFNAELYYYSLNTLKAITNLQTAGIYFRFNNDQFSYDVQLAFQFGAALQNVDFAASYLYAMIDYKLSDESDAAIAFEMLSGDDGSDVTKIKTFSPFFGTNHKFNGYMDKFFVGAHRIANINGLNDLVLSFSTLKSLKFDLHFFSNNQDAFRNLQKLSSSIGNEIDITYAYKYSNELSITPGFSYFIFSDDYKNSSDTNDIYLYLMLGVNF